MTRYGNVGSRGILTMLLASALLAGTASAKPRHGVIEDMQPIENRGEDTSEKTKRARTFGARLGAFGGLAAGVGLVKGGDATAGAAVMSVASAHGDTVGAAIGEKLSGPGATTRYMVKVRLDEGRVLSTTQPREQVGGLAIGTRVTVEGNGDEARIIAE